MPKSPSATSVRFRSLSAIKADVKQSARGRWPEILAAVTSIPAESLDGKHHGCFQCGGKDRFRMIDADEGALFCNQCFSTKNGDGIAAIQWALKLSFKDALLRLAEYLQIPTSESCERKPLDFADISAANAWLVKNCWAKKLKPTKGWYWGYHDSEGRIVGYTIRLDLPPDEENPNGSKLIRPLRRSTRKPDRWELGSLPEPRPLFRLPKIATSSRCWIVEGEKCVCELEAVGIVATTSVNGAKSPKKSDWSPLVDKEVILIPDNDSPGRAYVETIANILCQSSPRPMIKVLALDGLGEGEDISDWLQARDATDPEELRKQLENLADAAPLWVPQSNEAATVTPVDRPLLAPGTIVMAMDRGNFGDVISDDGAVISVHFVSKEGHERIRDFNPEELRLQDGRPLTQASAQPATQPIRIELIDSPSFATSNYRSRFLVKRVLVEGQPAILGGAQKTLKTSLAVDLAISLGSGMPFLGQFEIPEIVRVGVISGESGSFTLQETARRIAESKSVLLSECSVWWGFKLPQLGLTSHLAGLKEAIREYGLKVCIIDPAYLCLLRGDDGRAVNFANLFEVGAVLLRVAESFLECDCTPIILHHETKGAQNFRKQAGNFAPPELIDLSMSGFAEFARQWLLIGRREAYEHGSGLHRLWLNIGGSAGHGGLWSVDVNEGKLDDDFSGRIWEVTIGTADDARQSKAEASETRLTERERKRDEQHRARLLEAYRKYPAGETAKQLRLASKLNPAGFDRANYLLIEEGIVEECEITKNRKTHLALRLIAEKASGLFNEDDYAA